MRKLSIGVLGGLAALLGIVSAAAAETTISLIWQATGSSVISNPNTSGNIVLDVLLNGDSEGTTGGGVTVDYGTSGAVTIVSFTSNPDAVFDQTLGTTTDTGSQVRNLVGFNPFGPVAIDSSVRIGTITFHKEPAAGSATLTTLFTATDLIGGLTSPSSHGHADIIECATDECSIEKKCSVAGSPPQDACTASPGEEVTPTPMNSSAVAD
jgi:hypothetical protein